MFTNKVKILTSNTDSHLELITNEFLTKNPNISILKTDFQYWYDEKLGCNETLLIFYKEEK